MSPLPRRDARQIYNPPSGKYSASIGNFSYGEFDELGITVDFQCCELVHRI